MSSIAVIDIGKTNTKLCVVDSDSGDLLKSDSTSTRSVDQPPYLHIDTSSLWEWLLDQLTDAAKATDISTIVVTAHGATAALITDKDLALPVMDYEFTGPDSLTDEYNTLCDPFNKTYSPRLPHGLNIGRQLYWQRKHCPQDYRKAKQLLPYTQFWSWKLTGRAAAEVSTIGSHSDLWNPLEKCYSNFAVQQNFAQLLPPMKLAGDTLGPLTEPIQQRTGLSRHCKVLVGIHDSNASLIPWLKSRATPFTVMSTGTWVIIFALGAPLDTLLEQRDCTANVNIYSEPIACARFMGGREFGAIAGTSAQSADVNDLQRIIDDNIIALPAFADSGGPYPGHQGSIQSGRDLSPPERYALACVYCALTSDESLTLCGSTGDIIVEGAFAKNHLLLQCLAVFRSDNNQAVLASADSTGTTLGAAMLAADTISAPALQRITPFEPALAAQLNRYRHYWHQQIALCAPSSQPPTAA